MRPAECIPVSCSVPVAWAKCVRALVFSAPVVCGLQLQEPVPLETPHPTRVEGREVLLPLCVLPFHCPSLEEAQPPQMFVEQVDTQTAFRLLRYSLV